MKTKVLAAVISVGALMLSENVLATNSRLAIPDPGSATARTPSDKRPIINPDSIDFGAYDPHGDFTEDPNSRIEHLFLPWEDVDLSSLAIADEYALQRGRSLLITVEPWSWSREWRVTSQELLKTILSGQRDKYMAAVCSEADKLKSPVTIRWAQEMDEVDNQFIWAHWKPEEYVAAYRRMVTVCRQNLGNAKYMWSPKGNEGLEAFYPGPEFVDEVGLSIFGYQPYDQGVVGHDTTFVEQLTTKYDRVKGFSKPIVVAELGYDGDPAYVRNWAENVAKSRPEFPDLTAVVYFNDREVYPWPDGYGLPDWRVVPQLQN